MTESSSSSAFVVSGSFSRQWSDISLLQSRSRNLIYTGVRYGRRFLLKTLRPEHCNLTEYRQLHEKEFRLGISLNHPNIAATYSYEDITLPLPLSESPSSGTKNISASTICQSFPCIVQEYIDGMPLSGWLETKPSNAARRRVFLQLLDALEYLHERQLVHNDLKSGNILITRNGSNLKLIDFGLSNTDDSLTQRSNDMREDIRSLAPLIKKLFPHRYTLICRRCSRGVYSNIAALRSALQLRQRFVLFLPILMSLLLIALSIIILINGNKHLNETRHVLDSVDIVEIQAALDKAYNEPVSDSLCLPDAGYQEIANVYLNVINTIDTYYDMSARYPVGSVQHTLFTQAWTSVYTDNFNRWRKEIESRPSFVKEYREGRLSRDEYNRLNFLIADIISRNR